MKRAGFLRRMLTVPIGVRFWEQHEKWKPLELAPPKIEPIGKVARVDLPLGRYYESRRPFILAANWERGAFPEGERLDLYSDPWPIQHPVDVTHMRYMGGLFLDFAERDGAHTELCMWNHIEGIRHFYLVPSVPVEFEAYITFGAHSDLTSYFEEVESDDP